MKPAVVTIGVFDGVHRGHQYMFRQVAERARALGVGSFAVTFHPLPEAVLHPERQPTYLTDPEEKVRLIRATGVDDVWVCPFTRELSQLAPEAFLQRVADRQPIGELWIGPDFALGRGRSGTLPVLAEIGSAHSWALHVVPPYRLDGQVVSSTAIRNLLAAGSVHRAADLLGRPYSVRGRLVAETPTTQLLRTDAGRAIPSAGVYVAEVTDDLGSRQAMVAVLPPDGQGKERAEVRVMLPRSSAAAAGGTSGVGFVEWLRPLDEAPRRTLLPDLDKLAR